jgi:uncharacterized protein
LAKKKTVEKTDSGKDGRENLEQIRNLVANVVDRGTHIDVAKTTQYIARTLGLNERLVNYTHTELRNKLNEFRFRKVPYSERILFLPHCLKNSEKCKAPIGKYGLECLDCGQCQITELRKMALDLGYKGVYVAPGGSLVYKIMVEQRPKAVVGVGCAAEVDMGMDKASENNIPVQGVILLRDGCKDTRANLEEVKEKLELFENGNSEKKPKKNS